MSKLICATCGKENPPEFKERYCADATCIGMMVQASPNPTKLTNKPNVVFGVLTNGEIFVEVGGEQYTPDDGFYKMAAIQSSILAHKVRDLELALADSQQKKKNLYARLKKKDKLFNEFTFQWDKA